MRAVLSVLALAINLPLGLKATATACFFCCGKARTSRPLRVFHRRTVSSRPPVSSRHDEVRAAKDRSQEVPVDIHNRTDAGSEQSFTQCRLGALTRRTADSLESEKKAQLWVSVELCCSARVELAGFRLPRLASSLTAL